MKLKKIVGFAGLTAFLASWIAVGVGALAGVDRNTWVALVVIAAFATEALVWCVAFMLGMGVVEARGKIWHRVKKRFSSWQ
jgi:hypothetical protein